MQTQGQGGFYLFIYLFSFGEWRGGGGGEKNGWPSGFHIGIGKF